MNKAELVAKVAKKTKNTQAEVNRILTAILTAIQRGTARKKKVVLSGFGTFMLSRRPAQVRRNPRNGAVVQVPAKTVPVFKAGKNFKAIVAKRSR